MRQYDFVDIYIKSRKHAKGAGFFYMLSLGGAFMIFNSDTILIGIIWIMFCGGLAYYSSNGYYLDLVLKRVVMIEAFEEKWGTFTMSGKQTTYGREKKIITNDNRSIVLTYCDRIREDMENKRSTLIKPNEKYRTVYYYFKKSKVIVDVDFIPTGEFIQNEKEKKKGTKK